MTATTAPFGRVSDHDDQDEPRSILAGPSEGWSTLALLLVMLATVAVAIDDSNWAGIGVGNATQTSFLAMGIVLAALIGTILAKSRLPTVVAHLVGAAAGAASLLVAVANAISDAPSLAGRLRDLNASAATFYNDVVVLGIRSAETSIFLLTLGAIVWTTGQFAAFNVFRRGRTTTAVLVSGAVLLVNVSVTIRPQYLHLIVFSLAAMLLLARMNLFQQRTGWRRRRIGDAGYISGVFMRGAAVFVAVTLTGAITLAATASSAPLANAWRNLDDQLLSLGVESNRWVGGVTGAARGPSGLFTSSQTIRGFWESSPQIVFRAATSDGRPYYWRAATYDDFDGTTWQRLEPVRATVEPGAVLLGATRDGLLDDEGRREVTMTVTSVDMAGGSVVAPETPIVADRVVEVITNGEAGPYAAMELVDELLPGDSYTVASLVREEDPALGGVTEAELAAAGVDYPFWTRRYVEIRPGSVGELTYNTAERIVDQLPEHRRDPYHVAQAVQRFLYQTGGFQYRTNVQGLCGRDKIVDCFLRIRSGYCEYFATAMVMLLRTQQIPARMAMGYLPGKQLDDGSWEVARSAAHAWVEVYFPGYGWIKFDPTPGNQENGQTPTRLDPGEPTSTPQPGGPNVPRPSPNFNEPDPRDDELLGPQPGGSGPDESAPAGGRGPDGGLVSALAVALLLLAVLALGVLARSRRVQTPEPDLAYRSVARLATRFGYGPRPTQTAYEYATSLGDVVPGVRSELQVVARAKVEATYARRALETDALEALRGALRRVHIGLLRLMVRRRPRRSRPTELRRR